MSALHNAMSSSLHRLLLRIELVLGRQMQALQRLDRWLHAHPHDAHSLATRAHLLAASGQWTCAARDLQALCEQAPEVAAHWFNRGYVLEQLEDVSQAEACFRRALTLDAGLDRAWYGLGLVLVRQSRLDEALQALSRNTELQPMSPHGWVELARIHDMRKESEQVQAIVRHLRGFEPRVAAQLAQQMGGKA